MKLSGTELKKIRKTLNMNQKDLATLLETSQGYVSQLESDFAAKDLPEGVKTVFLPFLKKNHTNIYDQIVDNQTYIISKIVNHTEDVSQEDYIQKAKSEGVPFLNVDFFASNAAAIDDITALSAEFFITIPFFRDCDFAIRVTGDSMHPKICNGDIVVVKEIRSRDFIVFGEIYLIVTKTDNYRVVKYLHQDVNDSNYLLISYNDKIKPFTMPKSELLRLFLVKGKLHQMSL